MSNQQAPKARSPKEDGAFSKATVESLARRSCWICNNPTCQSITIGPTSDNSLATKVGEAANIHGEKPTAARWVKMDEKEIRAFDNGIWLCARCHTMIDKNKGEGFPSETLRAWKTAHEELLKAMLLSGRSPLPYLRTFTDEGQIAQELVDALGRRGAMFQEMVFEAGPAVLSSIETLRDEIEGFCKRVRFDRVLRDRMDTLYAHFRQYMNHTSKIRGWNPEKLLELRNNVATFLLIMQNAYGCKIQGSIRDILPETVGRH